MHIYKDSRQKVPKTEISDKKNHFIITIVCKWKYKKNKNVIKHIILCLNSLLATILLEKKHKILTVTIFTVDFDLLLC